MGERKGGTCACGGLARDWIGVRKGGSGVRAGASRACPGLEPGRDVYVMRGVGPLSRPSVLARASKNQDFVILLYASMDIMAA